MKTISKSVGLLVLSLAIFSVGCGSSIQGELKLTGTQKIPLIDVDGNRVELGAGAATMSFKGPFRPRLQIESLGQTVSIKIPRKAAIQSEKNFYLEGLKLGQPVDIDAKTRFDLVGSKEVYRTVGCFAPGVCYGPCYGYYGCRYSAQDVSLNELMPEHYGPYPEPYPPYGPSYGYAYRSDCPGNRDVKQTIETRREVLSVGFRDTTLSDRPVMGSFDADRGLLDDVVDETILTSCRVY